MRALNTNFKTKRTFIEGRVKIQFDIKNSQRINTFKITLKIG